MTPITQTVATKETNITKQVSQINPPIKHSSIKAVREAKEITKLKGYKKRKKKIITTQRDCINRTTSPTLKKEKEKRSTYAKLSLYIEKVPYESIKIIYNTHVRNTNQRYVRIATCPTTTDQLISKRYLCSIMAKKGINKKKGGTK